VHNVIVLLIFTIAAFIRLSNIQLTTSQCSLITKVQRTRAHIQCQIPSTAGRALGMRTWRELGLVASVTRADVGGIKDYTMVPVTAGGPGASQTDHRLTVLHAANRAKTASVIMPSRRRGVSA